MQPLPDTKKEQLSEHESSERNCSEASASNRLDSQYGDEMEDDCSYAHSEMECDLEDEAEYSDDASINIKILSQKEEAVSEHESQKEQEQEPSEHESQ